METLLDILAVVVFLLIVPSVVWAVSTERKEVSRVLAVFVGIFAVIFGFVFMSAASQLATNSAAQAVLLAFLVIIAFLAYQIWASKPGAAVQ